MKSEASFQATLSACCRHLPTPVVYVEVAPSHKAADQRDLKRGQGRLFEDDQPVAMLRAIEVIPNPAARAQRCFIPPNMRIPEGSIIHQLYSQNEGQSLVGEENLSAWELSSGQPLADQLVWIEAKRMPDRVLALLQPICRAISGGS